MCACVYTRVWFSYASLLRFGQCTLCLRAYLCSAPNPVMKPHMFIFAPIFRPQVIANSVACRQSMDAIARTHYIMKSAVRFLVCM